MKTKANKNAKKTPTPAPAASKPKTVSTVSNKPAPKLDTASVKKAMSGKHDRKSKLLQLGAAMEEAEKTPVVPLQAEANLAHALEKAAPPPPAPVGAPPIAAPVVKPVAPAIEIVPDTTAPGKKRYISKTAPDSKYHLRDRSTAEAPVSIVKRLSQQGLDEHWTRKAVLDACIAAGVNKNTAQTQYAVFHKKIKDEAEKQRLLAAAGEAGGDEEGEE